MNCVNVKKNYETQISISFNQYLFKKIHPLKSSTYFSGARNFSIQGTSNFICPTFLFCQNKILNTKKIYFC